MAKNKREIEQLVERFQKNLQENPEQIKDEGNKIKLFCFSEPTEELINQAFEID